MVGKIVSFIKARLRKALWEELWLEDYIKLGMKVGSNCSIQPGVVFDYSHCWLIRIGNNVTIAPQVYILAHDASTKRLLDYTKIGSVTIEDDVFIGARAIVMPGVSIGKGSIIAAGSVVTKSIPAGSVAAGNPAKVISSVRDYVDKCKSMMNSTMQYDHTQTLTGNMTDQEKDTMYRDLMEHIGFVK